MNERSRYQPLHEERHRRSKAPLRSQELPDFLRHDAQEDGIAVYQGLSREAYAQRVLE